MPISQSITVLGVKLSADLSWTSHINDTMIALDQRIGLLRRLAHHVPRQHLRPIAEGLCISKVRYCLPAFASPRMSETDPLCGQMACLQKKINNVMRIITGNRLEDKVSIADLSAKSGIMTVNRMAVSSILREMWTVINLQPDSELREQLLDKRSSTTISTRSLAAGMLELTKPVQSFACRGAKLWNRAPNTIKNAKTKHVAKKEIKCFLKKVPL